MSSSDLASPDKAISKELSSDEEIDSLDASLDAILSEAKESGEVPGLPAVEPPAAEAILVPPGEVQVAAEPTAAAAAVDDDMETPLPVIVDELPTYKAFADEVAPASAEDPGAELAAAAAVEGAPAAASATLEEVPAASAAKPDDEAEEIFEAEALVESETPAPEVSDPASLAATQETPAQPAVPPTDDEILRHVVLPPGTTPAPLAGSALGDDDRTVISPMPPIPEPAPMPPLRPTWGATPVASEVTASIPLSTRGGDGFTDKLLKLAGARVQTSVGMLAFVVVAASALGGVVVSLAVGGGEPTTTTKIVSPAATQSAAALPKEPALPPAVEPKIEAPASAAAAPAVAEKPAAAKPAPRTVVAKPRPAPTRVALAAPKPAAPAAAAPKPAAAAGAAAAAAAKSKKPAQGNNWVDPFAQ
jgi:hypothetical protein